VTSSGIPSPQETQWADGLPRWLLIVPIIVIAGLVAAYVYGIPMLAEAVAHRLPASIAETLSESTLASMDRDLFRPSAIPAERRQEIEARFRALKVPAGSKAAYRLEFRKSDEIGANAMALPSGIIVVTDGLVALARDDREIVGVLAHEAGHVERRHGLRGIVQNSLIGMVIAWVIGDVSSIAAAAPAVLLEASYSRDLEREADLFAIDVLRGNGIPLRHLADMLRRLESAAGAPGTSSALRYLSTHPATDERIARLDEP
jgi:Zn-dependent protease with chaperone function